MTMTIPTDTQLATPRRPSEAGLVAHSLEPNSFPEALELAKVIAHAGFKGLDTPGAVLMAMMRGREIGLPTGTALQVVSIIEGKTSVGADAMKSLVMRSGTCERFEVLESTATVCKIVVQRSGQDEKERTYTWEDAVRAGLVKDKGAYMKIPATMLRHRCESEACREIWPDVVLGLYTPDELVDPERAEPVHVVRSQVLAPKEAPQPTPAPAQRAPVVAAAGGSDGGSGKPKAPADNPIDAPAAPRDWIAEINAAETVAALNALGKEMLAAVRAKEISMAQAREIGTRSAARKAEIESATAVAS